MAHDVRLRPRDRMGRQDQGTRRRRRGGASSLNPRAASRRRAGGEPGAGTRGGRDEVAGGAPRPVVLRIRQDLGQQRGASGLVLLVMAGMLEQVTVKPGSVARSKATRAQAD